MTFLWWGYNGPFPLWSVAGFWRVWIVRCLVCVGSWRRDSQLDTRTTSSTGQHGVWLCWQASQRGWLSTLTPPCLSSLQAVTDWTDLPVTDRLLPQPDLSLRRMQASGVQVRLTDLGGTLDGFFFLFMLRQWWTLLSGLGLPIHSAVCYHYEFPPLAQSSPLHHEYAPWAAAELNWNSQLWFYSTGLVYLL